MIIYGSKRIREELPCWLSLEEIESGPSGTIAVVETGLIPRIGIGRITPSITTHRCASNV